MIRHIFNLPYYAIIDATRPNRALDTAPIILVPLWPAHDYQPIICVFLRNFCKSINQVFEAFVRSNISKEQHGFIDVIQAQMASCLAA